MLGLPNNWGVKMSYFMNVAAQLIANGYYPLPVKRDKSIHIPNWQKLKLNDVEDIDLLIPTSYLKSHTGAGVLCNNTGLIGIDIDVYDEGIAALMIQYMRDKFGDGLLFRYGGRPKVLIPMQYQGEQNNKRMSAAFMTGNNRSRIEILRGGKFVAYNEYDNADGEYVWERYTPSGTTTRKNASLVDVKLEDLPIIDESGITALLNYYEKVCASRGLSDKTATKVDEFEDDDDGLAGDKSKVSMSIQEIFQLLKDLVSLDDSYVLDNDQWVRVGMALYHQTDGDKVGYDAWIKWSKLGGTAFNDKDHEKGEHKKRWDSFDPERNDNDVITMRSIIYEYNQLRKNEEIKYHVSLVERLKSCKTYEEISEIVEEISEKEMPQMRREMFVPEVKAAFNAINLSISSAAIRKEIQFKSHLYGVVPEWCKNWVYVNDRESFFNIQTMEEMSPFTFDANFNKQANVDSDKAVKAHRVALDVHNVPKVTDIRYNPIQGEIFTLENRTYANYYRRDTLPDVPDQYTEQQKWGVEVFRKHIMEHLVDNEKDARTFMDWLAFIVQNSGEMVGWACVLQGVEGDGKSTIAYIMQYVLGKPNVRIIGNEVVQGAFKSWVGGHVLCAIEEIDITGKEKYQILNNMKQYITNPEVDLHQKGKNATTVDNFSNYLFLTNNPFALPVTEKDRRYFFMRSRFQTRSDLVNFKVSNPMYYPDLIYVRNNPSIFAGAIRKFLLEHEIDDSFNSTREAPMNEVKQEVIMEAVGSDEMVMLKQVLKESTTLGSNRELFDLTTFIKNYVDEEEAPRLKRAWKKFFSEIGMRRLAGFVKVGRRQHIFYSSDLSKWTKDGSTNGLLDEEAVKKVVNFKYDEDWYQEEL